MWGNVRYAPFLYGYIYGRLSHSRRPSAFVTALEIVFIKEGATNDLCQPTSTCYIVYINLKYGGSKHFSLKWHQALVNPFSMR